MTDTITRTLVDAVHYLSPIYTRKEDWSKAYEDDDRWKGIHHEEDPTDKFSEFSEWLSWNTIDGRTVIDSNGTHHALYESYKKDHNKDGKIHTIKYMRFIRILSAPAGAGPPEELIELLERHGYKEAMTPKRTETDFSRLVAR